MFLYLVQHADSLARETDPEQPLSEKGGEDIKRVAGRLAASGVRPVQIFHSVKKRARQSAEILAEALKPVQGVSEQEGLAPMDPPELWAGHIRHEKRETMIVGHLPHLEKLASLLLAEDPEKRIIAFQRGSVLCLGRDRENASGPWSVFWMLVPGMA